jgi:act minimal PKS acyl carrier protein
MSTLTVDDLRRILITVAGQQEGVDLGGDIAGTSFEDLGYDSLALMEMAATIEQEYGIRIDEDTAAALGTPGAVLDLVNGMTERAS